LLISPIYQGNCQEIGVQLDSRLVREKKDARSHAVLEQFVRFNDMFQSFPPIRDDDNAQSLETEEGSVKSLPPRLIVGEQLSIY
jgi:hypothetical protein